MIALAAALMAAVCVDWSHEYWSVALPQICAFALVTIWTIRLLWTAEIAHIPPVFWPVVLMALWGPLQIALNLTTSRYTTAVSAMTWAAAAAYLYLGANLLRAKDLRTRFLNILTVFATAIAVLAVLQLYTAPDLVFWSIPAHGTIGPFIYKNHFAAFVELIFPVAVYRVLVDHEHSLLWGFTAAALFAAVVVSASRGGVALLGGELVLILALGASRRLIPARRAWILSLQLPVIFAVLVSIFGWNAIWEHFHESSSGAIRKELLISTSQMIQTRPMQGYGLGTWSMIYPRFAHFDTTQFANEAHNDWAQWAAEGGLPFALLPLLVAGWSVWGGIRRPWALGPAVIFCHSVFDYPLRDPAVISLTFVILGAMAGATETDARGAGHPRSKPRD